MSSPQPSEARRWIRLVAMILPAVAFLALLAVASGRTAPPSPGDPAPDFEAPVLGEEGSLALADLRGRPVVINFWASWCLPCEDEAPLLRRAAQTYGDRISFVGVNIKDAHSDALDFEERFEPGYPSVRDEDLQIYDDYGLTGQPETFFVDADGTIVEHIPGELTEDSLMALLDALATRDGA